MEQLFRFRVTLRHDHGTIALDLGARNAEDATREACRVEGAPERAVRSVKLLDIYCCRIKLQKFGGDTVFRSPSIAFARRRFENLLHESRGWRDDEACSLWISRSPEPCECDSQCNFHDYPTAVFELGPRGGMREVAV